MVNRPEVDPWCPWNEGKVPRCIEGMNRDGILRLAEFREGTTIEWKMELLQAWFPPREVEEIIKLQWPFIECQDKILWMASDNGVFSVKSCHKLLTNQGGMENVGRVWKGIWKAKIHERRKMFI